MVKLSDLDHPCRDTCSGWQQGFERGEQKMRYHLKSKIDLADRMACFLKNHRFFIEDDDWRKDANELVDAWFKRSSEN